MKNRQPVPPKTQQIVRVSFLLESTYENGATAKQGGGFLFLLLFLCSKGGTSCLTRGVDRLVQVDTTDTDRLAGDPVTLRHHARSALPCRCRATRLLYWAERHHGKRCCRGRGPYLGRCTARPYDDTGSKMSHERRSSRVGHGIVEANHERVAGSAACRSRRSCE